MLDTPAAVLLDLLNRGFAVAATDAGGLVVVPREALGADDVAAIVRHKADLVALARLRPVPVVEPENAFEEWFVKWLEVRDGGPLCGERRAAPAPAGRHAEESAAEAEEDAMAGPNAGRWRVYRLASGGEVWRRGRADTPGGYQLKRCQVSAGRPHGAVMWRWADEDAWQPWPARAGDAPPA